MPFNRENHIKTKEEEKQKDPALVRRLVPPPHLQEQSDQPDLGPT